jgi:hypothetical protein
MARRPGPSLARRIGSRLPPLGRLVAGLLAAVVAGGSVALVSGPWLRVSQVAWAGEHFTDDGDLERLLAPQAGASLLSLDTRALSASLRHLPAIAEAGVEAGLDGTLRAVIVERAPAFIWDTARARLLGDASGQLFASLEVDGDLPRGLAALPVIHDERRAARRLAIGDAVPSALVETARRLVALDPLALGSTATDLGVRLEDEHGFVLIAADPGWEIAFGMHATDPAEERPELATEIDRQVAAVRTLFATEPEAGIGWVDVRNPGKVYFRAKD